MNVNAILSAEVSAVNSNLIPVDTDLSNRSIRGIQSYVAQIIDELGAESSKAQGLSRVITTSEKVRKSDATLYLIKDAQANNGSGGIVGLLKVGPKKLMISNGSVLYEGTPLCILDFYVIPNYQRRGYGQKLFQYMMADQRVTNPNKLALDGPSQNLLNFMAHKIGCSGFTKYANNFAVTDEFFQPESKFNRQTPLGAVQREKSPSPVGRYMHAGPQSTIGKVLHGDNFSVEDTHEDSPYHWQLVSERSVAVRPNTLMPPNMSERRSPTPEAKTPEMVKSPQNLRASPVPSEEPDYAKHTYSGSGSIDGDGVKAAGYSSHPDDPVNQKGYVDLHHHTKLW